MGCNGDILGLFHTLMIPSLHGQQPLAYVQESKLSASQIQWPSELALFDFFIKYQKGHSNGVTDALSHHPFNPSC